MNKTRIITVLLSISLVLFSFGQLARISIPEQPVFFYLYEVFVAAVSGILLVKYRKNPLMESKYSPIIVFFIWILISFVLSLRFYSLEQNTVAFLYYLRLLLYFIFYVYVSYFFTHEKQSKRPIVILNLVTVWVILSSFIQYFLYQNLGNLAYLGWDPHLYRVVGLFFDPPVTVSVFLLLMIFYLLELQSNHDWKKLGFIIPLFILSFLTYSRGGGLALIAVSVLYVIRRFSRKTVLIGLAVLVAGFLFIPKGSSEGINLLRTTSIEARINDYEKAIMIWRKNPVAGIGYNHIRYEKDIYEEQLFYGPYNPSHGSTAFHSSFLVILVTGGVIGLGLYIWMLISLARTSEFMMFGIVLLSVISVFDNVLLHPFLLFLLFLLEGYRKSHRTQSSL
ncbi:O-antigen ligase family protein [Candidatus Roizmanbacteria bacterium]|nr:MAG: O-antigen ligase family protein [Candidatus Roizmanbacteria bacterium]